VKGDPDPQDRCRVPSCASPDLFSGYFDAEGLAVPDDSQPGWRWATYCLDCGAEWAPRRPRRAKVLT
jgi:hypothetical protein